VHAKQVTSITFYHISKGWIEKYTKYTNTQIHNTQNQDMK